jgi:hypothetical protein
MDNDSKLRLSKKSQSRKIDLAVALSMACSMPPPLNGECPAWRRVGERQGDARGYL